MDRAISEHEISYLALHLEQFYEGPEFLTCLDIKSPSPSTSGIQIPLSTLALDLDKVIFIKGIPVLFPSSAKKSWFSREGKHLAFNHDILKSAFYLLSGIQEQEKEHYDKNGRYAWKHSLQKRLGITGIPVVNYYFEIILDALEIHCSEQGLPFSRRQPLNPVLFLSHDIDRIKKYSFRNLIHVGINIWRKGYGGRTLNQRIRDFFLYLIGTVTNKRDPYQNFTEMMDLEKELDIRSSWYLLEQRGSQNSKYSFNDPEILGLTAKLAEGGHEVALHGTLQSSGNPRILKCEKERLENAIQEEVKGIRQHFLKYIHPQSAKAQEETGFLYDASLAFAERPGFRHSFAHPFRPYDFEREKAMDIIQIPLLVMEVSLLEYMRSPVAELQKIISPILDQCIRFNGVFSLLWHNCRLDEEAYPGISQAYRKVLEMALNKGCLSKTGIEIAQKAW